MRVRQAPLSDLVWERALLALIGDEYQIGEQLFGVLLTKKSNVDTITFWVKSADDKEVVYRVREVLKRALRIPENSVFDFVPLAQRNKAHAKRMERAAATAASHAAAQPPSSTAAAGGGGAAAAAGAAEPGKDTVGEETPDGGA